MYSEASRQAAPHSMQRKLPDWMEERLAVKRANEELDAALSQVSGGTIRLSPVSSQSSDSEDEEGGGYTLQKLKDLENRLYQHVDRMSSPRSPQDGIGSQGSNASEAWSETSLPQDFEDRALADFLLLHMGKEEIRSLCEPYSVFSKESLCNDADFHADLYNGLRDHLFVCYRLVYAAVKKLEDEDKGEDKEEDKKEVKKEDGTQQPLSDVSNSPAKKFGTPSRAAESHQQPAECPSVAAKPVRSSLKRILSGDLENAQPSSPIQESAPKRVRFGGEEFAPGGR